LLAGGPEGCLFWQETVQEGPECAWNVCHCGLQERIKQLYNNYVDQGSAVHMLRCLAVKLEAANVITCAFEMYASLYNPPLPFDPHHPGHIR